jgi:hypothetical protein
MLNWPVSPAIWPTVRCLIGAVAVCLLATVEPVSAQRQLNYDGQSDVSVNVSYSNLPASTQLFYVNEVSGAKWAALVPLVGGSGTMALPMPPGPGHYSIMSMEGGNWVAQTVVFYSKDPASSGTSSSGTSWSVTITNDGQVTSFGGSAIDGNISYNTAPPPPSDPTSVHYLLDSAGGYVLDSTGGKLTAP